MRKRNRLGIWQGTLWLVLLVSLLLAIGLLSSSTVGAHNPSPTPTPARGGPTPWITMTVPDVVAREEIERPAKGNPKLGSSLSQLLEAYHRGGVVEARAFATTRMVVLDDDRVQVVIVTTQEAIGNLKEAVEDLGGEYQIHYEALLQALVPIDALESLAGRPDVQVVREPRWPIPLAPMQVGDQTTKGVATSNASAWHAAGYTGSGVRIAVIDGGFTNYVSLLDTDLPASVTTYDWTGTGMGGSPHGTACAEIVYDMAYGATMDLHKVSTDVELGNAVNRAITDGVDIISMSLGWIIDGPGDGTGNLASIVNNARSNGIFYATAAGNDAEVSWSGVYLNFNPGTYDYHAWDGTKKWYNFIGPGAGTCYVFTAGTPIWAGLHWDDWTTVNQDYDLHLYRYPGGSTIYRVASSTNPQNGGGGQTPEEFVSYTASGSDCYAFVVERVRATRNVCLRLVAPKMGHLDQWVTQRSQTFPADSRDAFTVGAVDVSSPYPLESYSSRGPTFGPGGTCAGGFVKPDITAYANVSTVSYGPEAFNGTSAAAPHIAGAAALVKQAYPAYTVDQLQSYLESNAMDLGDPGKDNLYGSGRLYLPQVATPTPTSTETPTPTPTTGTPVPAIARIAFVSNRDGNWEIYVMNADGSSQTRLTNNTTDDMSPDWSPDGMKIAFHRGSNIYVMNADGAGSTMLTTNGSEPDWSPDGAKIAFNCSGNICVMNADGTGRITLTSTGSDYSPSWSPDGTKITFQSLRLGGDYEIYVMNADGSNQTRLAEIPDSDWDPAWSPDGTRIAFWNGSHDGAEIYVINVDGTGLTRLTNNTVGDYELAWSSDSTRIVFRQGRLTGAEIYVMNADSTGLTRLTSNSAFDGYPDWSSAGPTPTPTHTPTSTPATGTPTPTGVPPPGSTIYLPIIMKVWPPIPDVPELHDISNPDGDGNYTVTWSPAARATGYALEEDDDPTFPSPATRYSGYGTSWTASGKEIGTYYYRVRASNSWGDSGWSHVQSVSVHQAVSKFYPVGDTTVLQGYPNDNFGTTTDMWVGYDHCLGGKIARSLVQFDLSSIPAGMSISQAKLYLYLVNSCDIGERTHSVTVYRAKAGWSESSVTWNTRPDYAEGYGSAPIPSRTWGWYSFDVTGLVRGWVNGSFANHGMVIRGPESSGDDSAQLGFCTRNKYGRTYDPYLSIEYAGMAAFEEAVPAMEGTPDLAECGPTIKDMLSTSPGTSNSDMFEAIEDMVCSPD